MCLLVILFSYNVFGQFSLPRKHEPDSSFTPYIFPVNPGVTNYLSGTMGELRSTHFHAGLDIRTNNMEGIPILAVKDGYISRIILGTGGYGKAVFIAHPDGRTSLYGHLSALKGKYGAYARGQQYQKKSFEVDLWPAPNLLPVKAGDTIAFSGNTGGSNGAHLHFEIRDGNNEALNPLKFGFHEIIDTYAPVAQKIALKTMDINARINDRFGRFEFYVYRIGNHYIFSKPIIAHGNIGVEILAHDIVDHYKFTCGINYIEMRADSNRIFSQAIEKVNFLTTRDILTVLDYKILKRQGYHYNKLYVEDGNGLHYSDGSRRNGIIQVKEKDIPVNIILRDTYGNQSTVDFTLKAFPLTTEVTMTDPVKKIFSYDLDENTLAINVSSCTGKSNDVTIFSGREKHPLTPAYGNAYFNAYLLDLRTNLPDSVVSCNGTLRFDFKDAIPSGTEYKFYGDFADITFSGSSLYDTLYLNMSSTQPGGQELFTIGNPNIPLRRPIAVSLKPRANYVMDKKTAVYRISGRQSGYSGGEWQNGRMKFYTQDLGTFAILRDTVPPVILRLALNHSTARFRIADTLSGIASFNAYINGEWLLMNYDYKTGLLESERLEPMKQLKGEFILKVTDNVGNEKTYNQKIL